MYANACGGYCDADSFSISSKDRKAWLKEKEAILEAKLATVKHLIEESDRDSEKE